MEMNPFPTSGNNALAVKPQQANALMEVEQQRAIAEVQSAIILAKRFPRNQIEAMDRILVACQRPTLAEQALYSYSRGGSDITGPSIRLAEAIAQSWGNLQFGIRELSQANGESTVEAYAWDVETNTRQVKIFQVPHVRFTKSNGRKTLEDPRDIYEAIANQGARRLRACILGIIPGDVVEAAVSQSEQTLKAKADTSPEALKKLVDAFESYKVSKEQIEKKIQRHLDAITPAQIVSLRKIYNSLKDGMSGPADWFEVDTDAEPAKTSNVNETLKNKLRDRKKAEVIPEPEQPEPSQEPEQPSILPNLDADSDWPEVPDQTPCPECGEVGGHAMSCPNAEPPEGE
jgi:DNA-binding FadR family transcriptional regulator